MSKKGDRKAEKKAKSAANKAKKKTQRGLKSGKLITIEKYEVPKHTRRVPQKKKGK